MMKSAQKLSQRLISTIPYAFHRPRAPFPPVAQFFPHIQPTSTQASALQRLFSKSSLRSFARNAFNKRPYSTKPPLDPASNLQNSKPSLSLSQRMRKLSREYGWSALGVYLLLTAIDFPFCFLAVRWIGTEKIGQIEHVVVNWFWKVVPYPFPSGQEVAADDAGEIRQGHETSVREGNEVELVGDSHGVREAERSNQSENASESCFDVSWYPEYNSGLMLP